MGLIDLFAGFTGRIGRRGFWFGMIAVLVAASLAKLGATPDILSDKPLQALIENWRGMTAYEMAIYVVLLVPAMALVIKRLHDRNKSGLFALLFWAPALLSALIVLAPALKETIGYALWGIDWITAWIGAVGIWFFIELGFYGPRDPNKYGPDPRAD